MSNNPKHSSPGQRQSLRHNESGLSSEKIKLNVKARDYFYATQWRRLDNFFEQQGETVHNIFKQTTTISGVMVLFMVFNGLTKDVRDIVVKSNHIFKKNLLLPSTFDNIVLKKYRKLCTRNKYILKCKYCDFISSMSCTMEHMAFVHDRHFGFGIKPNARKNTNTTPSFRRFDVPITSYCIFQTPNSSTHHIFRDHFTPVINYRYKELDVHFNDPHHPLSDCYKKYMDYLKNNGKLYTLEECTHDKQFGDGNFCSCIKTSITFYERFHEELFELLNPLNLTNWREGRFEAIGYIRPQKLESPMGDDEVSMSKDTKYQKTRKHTRKSNIFSEFKERIEKVYTDFFSAIEDICEDSGDVVIVEKNTIPPPVIEIDSSNSSDSPKPYEPRPVPVASHVTNIINANTPYELQSTGAFGNLNTNPILYYILSDETNKSMAACQQFRQIVLPEPPMSDPTLANHKIQVTQSKSQHMHKLSPEKDNSTMAPPSVPAENITDNRSSAHVRETVSVDSTPRRMSLGAKRLMDNMMLNEIPKRARCNTDDSRCIAPCHDTVIASRSTPIQPHNNTEIEIKLPSKDVITAPEKDESPTVPESSYNSNPTEVGSVAEATSAAANDANVNGENRSSTPPATNGSTIFDILFLDDGKDRVTATATPYTNVMSDAPESENRKDCEAKECGAHSIEISEDSIREDDDDTVSHIEYTETYVEDSANRNSLVANFEKHVLSPSFQCDPLEDYKDYQALDHYLKMFEQVRCSIIEKQIAVCANPISPEKMSSFLRSLEFEEALLPPESPHEDCHEPVSTESTNLISRIALMQLENPDNGCSIFRDVLSLQCNPNDECCSPKQPEPALIPLNINVPTTFKADCETTNNQRILSNIKQIFTNKFINAKQLNEVLNLLKEFIESNQNVV